MSSFNTGFGQNDFAFTVTGSNYNLSGSHGLDSQRLSSNRHSASIPLSSLGQNRSNDTGTPGFLDPTEQAANGYEVEVRGQHVDAASVGSGQSEEMIIRKQVIMTVDRDSSRSATRRHKGM